MPIQSRNCEWESGDVNCMYIICFDVIRSTGNMLYFAVKNKSISDIAVLLLKIKPLQKKEKKKKNCVSRASNV